MIETRLRSIQHSESHPLRRHTHLRIHSAVNHNRVQERFRDRRHPRQWHRPNRARLIGSRPPVKTAPGILNSNLEIVRFVVVRVPQRPRIAPSPCWILPQDISGHEAFVLDDQRNSHQIRQQTRTHQPGLKIVDDDVGGRNSGVRVEPCNADRVIVVPHQARALIVRIVVGSRPR